MLLIPLAVELFWFKVTHYTGTVTLLPKTIRVQLPLNPCFNLSLNKLFGHRKAILMSSRSPISERGELALSEKKPKFLPLSRKPPNITHLEY